MNILKDVLSELFSMFVGDARLTAAILSVIALTAIMIYFVNLPAIASGGFLLFGCIIVLVTSVRREARRREVAPLISNNSPS